MHRVLPSNNPILDLCKLFLFHKQWPHSALCKWILPKCLSNSFAKYHSSSSSKQQMDTTPLLDKIIMAILMPLSKLQAVLPSI